MSKQEALDLIKEHTAYLREIRDEIKQAQNYLTEVDPAIAMSINETSNKNDGSDLITVLEEVVIPLLEREAKIEKWAKEVYGEVPIKRIDMRRLINQEK